MPTGQYIRKPRTLISRPAIYPISASIAYISLTNNLFALVDWDDAEWLSQWNWYAGKSRKLTYVQKEPRRDDVFRQTKMHQLILETSGRSITPDHRNGNGLDNRRSNLRLANHREQSINRGVRGDSKSGIKGCCWRDRYQKYAVAISIDGKRKHIGYLTTKEDAAQAYILAAYLHYGEFARLT